MAKHMFLFGDVETARRLSTSFLSKFPSNLWECKVVQETSALARDDTFGDTDLFVACLDTAQAVHTQLSLLKNFPTKGFKADARFIIVGVGGSDAVQTLNQAIALTMRGLSGDETSSLQALTTNLIKPETSEYDYVHHIQSEDEFPQLLQQLFAEDFPQAEIEEVKADELQPKTLIFVDDDDDKDNKDASSGIDTDTGAGAVSGKSVLNVLLAGVPNAGVSRAYCHFTDADYSESTSASDRSRRISLETCDEEFRGYEGILSDIPGTAGEDGKQGYATLGLDKAHVIVFFCDPTQSWVPQKGRLEMILNSRQFQKRQEVKIVLVESKQDTPDGNMHNYYDREEVMRFCSTHHYRARFIFEEANRRPFSISITAEAVTGMDELWQATWQTARQVYELQHPELPSAALSEVENDDEIRLEIKTPGETGAAEVPEKTEVATQTLNIAPLLIKGLFVGATTVGGGAIGHFAFDSPLWWQMFTETAAIGAGIGLGVGLLVLLASLAYQWKCAEASDDAEKDTSCLSRVNCWSTS